MGQESGGGGHGHGSLDLSRSSMGQKSLAQALWDASMEYPTPRLTTFDIFEY